MHLGCPVCCSLELLGQPLPAEPDRTSIIQFLASCQVRERCKQLHVSICGSCLVRLLLVQQQHPVPGQLQGEEGSS